MTSANICAGKSSIKPDTFLMNNEIDCSNLCLKQAKCDLFKIDNDKCILYNNSTCTSTTSTDNIWSKVVKNVFYNCDGMIYFLTFYVLCITCYFKTITLSILILVM